VIPNGRAPSTKDEKEGCGQQQQLRQHKILHRIIFFLTIHRFRDDPSNDDEKHMTVWIQCHMSDDINTMINAAAKPYWGWKDEAKVKKREPKKQDGISLRPLIDEEGSKVLFFFSMYPHTSTHAQRTQQAPWK
jgi:hypothetical protein